ncbi:glucose/arabinose dehydrogenase [Pontibacter ummariensis]|uniref:Glucose/arabinose dehydrogenase, beta-propeller fold n=1 Tax=Pontibacter ummariensis TaxID=1610492 RepID=A0A239C224_9BACT|nr:sorbosone dehydrogenase family protein [Pontibacter ummariensis]PRY15488.1 glucose/arabinose dehydrogenase [Pontibacter ummariensis]SNS14307.1 Glucose/arabinose dehydrogenase, beta-propeller fold [Pontibacter ummariensis]
MKSILNKTPLLALLAGTALWGCSKVQQVVSDENAVSEAKAETPLNYEPDADTVETAIGRLYLPAPDSTFEGEKFSETIGWPEGRTPQAPAGFTVTKYADGLEHPRWIYVAPNKDVFVVESNDEGKSANRIKLFRDTDQDGDPEVTETFLTGLNQPFGMLVLDGYFYVANTDGVVRFPYKKGQTKITGPGEKILDLPAGGYNHHWTRNLITNADSSKIYVSVGSASNVGEYGMDEEKRRANILEINPDGTGERIYASGLRNPVGMDWAPGTSTLWTAVNERDGLGNELVPDYITGVKEGAFYGWPFAYYGSNIDPRRVGERPDLVQQTIVPDVPLGSHVAALGLAFYEGDAFPAKYKNGAFVGEHGSWNRENFVGYKVVFVPFQNGRPSGEPEDFLTGFIANAEESEVYGRPVGVAELPDGSLLVADDEGNTIWRVAAQR